MGTVEGISKSGVNSAALEDDKTKQIVDIGTNQGFQVTEVIVTNSHTSTYVHLRLFDQAAIASSPTANLQRVPDIYVPPLETVRVAFTDGPKFYTEISGELEDGTGEVLIYNCQVNGVMF